MTCRFDVLSMVFLVCLHATSADAQTDLLWQHSDGGLAVWTMQRTRMLSGDPLGPGPLRDPLWRISAVADFNGDTLRDLVFQHQGDGRLAVWLMNRHAQVSGLALSPAQVPDLNWKVRGAGDFNGDLKPDLIWQNVPPVARARLQASEDWWARRESNHFQEGRSPAAYYSRSGAL